MTDAKIHYDIEAAVTGEESVEQLAQRLEGLGQTLDGDLKTQAIAAGEALRSLGEKQTAVATFQQLGNATQALGIELLEARNGVQQVESQLAQASTATQQFTRTELEAKAALEATKLQLDTTRKAYNELQATTTGSARSTDEYTASSTEMRSTLQRLTAELRQQNTDLKDAATQTKVAQQAENALSMQYQESSTALNKVQSELHEKTAALEASRTALKATGIETTNLAQAERNLGNAVTTLREQVKGLVPAHAQVAQASTTSTTQQVRDQKTVQAGMDNVRSSTQGAADVLRQMGPLVASAFSAQQFLQAITAQESLNRSFEQIFGSASKARAEMEFIRETANRLGLENQSLAQSYQSLAASTRGTTLEGQATRDVFEAVARAMSTLGKSSADTDRALTAISQIASKGTASMEELRGQLGEALPGAMKAAADGAGITVEQLVEMVSSGSVLASEILPALTKGLNDLYGNAAPPQTLISEWARFKNIMTDTATAMGESGATGIMVKGLGWASRAAVGFGDATVLTGTAIGEFTARVVTGNAEAYTMAERLDAAADRQNKLKTGMEGTTEAQKALTAAQQAGGDATQENFRKQELLAQKNEQVSTSMLGVKAKYAELSNGAAGYTKQLEKELAARTAETTAVTQLVNVYGSEIEKRQAAAGVADIQAEASRKLAMARDAEAIIAQSLAIRLQDEATKRGDTTEATRKEIEAAEKSAQAKRTEAEQSAASAQSKTIEAEATKASALAYQDNSARVNELRSAAAAAATEVDRLVRLQREGKATDEEVATARAKASAATLLYRDALHDASDAAERKIAVERQSAQIAQASISVDLERVKAQQEVAEANGDTAKSAQLAQQATMLQVRAAEQSAAASRAEAQAIRDAADVKERELRATGELTTAKLAELDAQRKNADMKDLEAQKADILAQKTRALAASESARTDVLEKQISAEEKKNALIERQIALEQKRLNIDKEGYSLDTGGKRVSADVITTRSVYEQAKSAGLDEKQSLDIANEFVVNGNVKTPDRANAAEGETSYTLIAKAIDKLVLANAAKAATGPTSSSPSPTPSPATKAAPPSPSPAPAAAAATTRNVNISVNSSPLGRMSLDELSEEVFDRLLKRLESDKRAAGY